MRKSEDFAAAVRRGAKAARSSLVVHVYPDAANPAEPVVGFVVSKSVGSAVERNRVKRRLRHLMRDHIATLPRGSRVVVRALPAALVSTTLAQDLLDALTQAGAL